VGRRGDRSHQHPCIAASLRVCRASTSGPGNHVSVHNLPRLFCIVVNLTPCLAFSCDESLQLLLRVRSTKAMVRSFNDGTAVSGQPEEDSREVGALLSKWMHSSTLHSAEAGPTACAPSKPQKSASVKLSSPTAPSAAQAGHGFAEQGEADHQHLVLVMPLCLDLVLSPCCAPQLKAVAAAAVKYVVVLPKVRVPMC
jgi:hypothetical protein